MARAKFLGAAVALAGLGTLAYLGLRSSSAPLQAEPPAGAAAEYARAVEFARDPGDLPRAVEAYRRALALEPSMAEAHYGLGLALLRSGDGEGAAAEIESALSLAPPDAAWRPDAENALVGALLLRSKERAGK